MKKSLIVYGGWEGHEPELVSRRFGGLLEEAKFSVTYSSALDCLLDLEELKNNDLIVSCWTMGELPAACSKNVVQAVGAGTGLAGCHGGLCDAFRQDTEWQFMTGGQWVAHPGNDGVEYTVNISSPSNPIVAGMHDFTVKSEQYYMHVDPAVEVLATTRFPVIPYYHSSNRPVDMPVAWTKMWGLGRVFYLSIGHHDDVFDAAPAAQEMMRRGMLWAADGKAAML